VAVLLGESVRELHEARADFDVGLVLFACRGNLLLQPRLEARGEHRAAIAAALASADGDLVTGEIHVLDPEAAALQ
jgi:hypothetical protein